MNGRKTPLIRGESWHLALGELQAVWLRCLQDSVIKWDLPSTLLSEEFSEIPQIFPESLPHPHHWRHKIPRRIPAVKSHVIWWSCQYVHRVINE